MTEEKPTAVLKPALQWCCPGCKTINYINFERPVKDVHELKKKVGLDSVPDEVQGPAGGWHLVPIEVMCRQCAGVFTTEDEDDEENPSFGTPGWDLD